MRKSSFSAAVLVLAATSVSFGQTVTNLVTDNFDDGQGSTRWDFQAREAGLDPTISGNVPDAFVDFAYNYTSTTFRNFDPSLNGASVVIPTAPRGGAKTAVKIQVNDGFGTGTVNAIAAAAILPKNSTVTGDYRLTVDVFADNAPYPSGSTETQLIGLNYSGTGVVGPTLDAIAANATAPGYAFANSTDGDLSGDYRVYAGSLANDDGPRFAKRNAAWTGSPGLVPYIDEDTGAYKGSNTNAEEAFNPYYWDLTEGRPNGVGHDGGVGKSWNTVTMTQRGNIVTYQIDGKIINTLFIPAPPPGTAKVSIGAFDPSSSKPADITESFYLIDNVQVDGLSSMPTNTISASDTYARFNGGASTVNGAFTMNGLQFDTAASTVAGTGTITLGTARNVGTASGAIYAGGGAAGSPMTHAISKPVAINASTAIYVDENTTLNMSNVSYPNSSAVLTKVGRGTLSMNGGIRAYGLQVSSGRMQVTGGVNKVNLLNLSYQSATTTADTARLDITKSIWVVDYTVLPLATGVTGTPDQSPFLTIAGYINAGFATDGNGNPTFTGPGIVSSSPDLQGANFATSGYVVREFEASSIGLTDGAPLGSSGVTVDSTSVIFGITFKSDNNFDGKVDFDDLVKLAQNYNSTGLDPVLSWTKGDTNADGKVDFDDLVPLAQQYNQSLSGLLGDPNDFAGDWLLAQSLVVPEPTTLSLLGLGAAAMIRRRR